MKKKEGHLGVSKNRGVSPKMDGENNGEPYFLMDDLGVPLFLETPTLLWGFCVFSKSLNMC